MKITILGADGMLGAGVVSALKDTQHELKLFFRRNLDTALFSSPRAGALDAEKVSITELAEISSDSDYIVNCIGSIKPRIVEGDPHSSKSAQMVNSFFPEKLARAAEQSGVKVIQIATDCVYSGKTGNYTEVSTHDPVDLYGETKSSGEIKSANFMHLRTSIIGPELERSTSLYEWFKNQPLKAELKGFTNHLWNGVSTWHFGKIVDGIVNERLFSSGTQHLIPSDQVSKYDLLRLFREKTGRGDVSIIPFEADEVVNRCLETDNPKINTALWKAAGYENPPAIRQIVNEMPASYDG